MLKRAADNYTSAIAGSVPQQNDNTRIQRFAYNNAKALNTNSSAINVPKPPPKRKFARSLSTQSTGSLSQLHGQVFFNENDFDSDDSIDFPVQKKTKETIAHSAADAVVYPTLPPATPTQSPPASTAPVPWSTSPLSHLVKPSTLEQSPQLAKKRTKLPWAQTTQASSSIPWELSASAVKNEHKELRRRHAAKVTGEKGREKPQENVPATHLSEEQLAVAKAVVDDGKSVFFTGSAGTGKSVLMRSIIARFRKKFTREPDRLAITASTGLAACVIEGSTLHSWAGIGLGKEAVPELCKRIKRNAKTKTKWLRTKVLIIDEISMVDGELFDKLEAVARTVRGSGRPFGGIQLVVTGDFFQLPPVPDKNIPVKFAFDAATWNTSIEHTILLTHVFRQKDPVFANMLNEMRLGKLSPESVRNFQKLSRPLASMDEIDATELFPTRGEVDSANSNRMQRLLGTEQIFAAVDSGTNDLKTREKVLSNFMAPEKLVLKKGAQVMLIKNIDGQLVNGTLGKILAFMEESTYAAYRDDEETYHQAYEASGASDDEGKAAAMAKFDAARYKNKDSGAKKLWPMVRFPLADGTYRDLLCMPEEWTTETQQGEIIAKRVQIPLILAWALSIHKAQGQTMSRVKVDLGKVFEKGQAYVALSRATSQDGLQVLRFDPRKVMVHPKVVHFYEKLDNIHSVVPKLERKGKHNKDIIELD